MFDPAYGLREFRRSIVKLTVFLNTSQTIPPVSEQFLSPLIGAIHEMAKAALGLYPGRADAGERSEEALLRRSVQRIAQLTSPELRKQWFYCGDGETLNEVWDEADRTPQYDEFGRYRYEGDLRTVTVSETWGPFRCEHHHPSNGRRCRHKTSTIFVSREELAGVPYETGPQLIRVVINGDKSLGKALCDIHEPPLREGVSTPAF